MVEPYQGATLEEKLLHIPPADWQAAMRHHSVCAQARPPKLISAVGIAESIYECSQPITNHDNAEVILEQMRRAGLVEPTRRKTVFRPKYSATYAKARRDYLRAQGSGDDA